MLVACLAHQVPRAAADRLIAGAERFEDAKPVLVNVDAGTRGAQPIGALVQPHAPAAPGERARRRQAGEAAADDLGPAFHWRRIADHDR